MSNPNWITVSTDWKALCAELVAWAEKTSSHYYIQPDVLLRARAALAEPVIPVKQRVFPTPSQAAECGGPCYEGNYCPEACNCGLYQRSALAEQPVGEGAPAVTTGEWLHPAYEPGDGSADGAQMVGLAWWHPQFGCDSLQMVVDNARAILARWGNHPAKPDSSFQETHQ